MNTKIVTRKLQAAQGARDKARLRRDRAVELKAFISGGTMVFTGLLLAAVYCLLSHQIPG